jgi:hypothetical protein
MYTDAAGRPVPAPCAGPASVSTGTSTSSVRARRPPSPVGSSSSGSARTRRVTASDLGGSADGRSTRPRVANSNLDALALPAARPPSLAPQPPPPQPPALDVAPVNTEFPGGLRPTLDPFVVRDLVTRASTPNLSPDVYGLTYSLLPPSLFCTHVSHASHTTHAHLPRRARNRQSTQVPGSCCLRHRCPSISEPAPWQHSSLRWHPSRRCRPQAYIR